MVEPLAFRLVFLGQAIGSSPSNFGNGDVWKRIQSQLLVAPDVRVLLDYNSFVTVLRLLIKNSVFQFTSYDVIIST